jgi:hypothetical protein
MTDMGNTPNAAARPERPTAWNDWYLFAKVELGYAHDERVEYANHRYVEEQNRAVLRKRAAGRRFV